VLLIRIIKSRIIRNLYKSQSVDKNRILQQLVRCLSTGLQMCQDANHAIQTIEEVRTPEMAQLMSASQRMTQRINDAFKILQDQDNGTKKL
jgi:hypothetical protein